MLKLYLNENLSWRISRLCHDENQPVFITRNGKGDLVVMSQTHYDHIISMMDLYHKLLEAERQDADGEKGVSHEDLMKRLKATIE